MEKNYFINNPLISSPLLFMLRLIEIEMIFFFQKPEIDTHPPHTTIREGRVLIFLVLSW